MKYATLRLRTAIWGWSLLALSLYVGQTAWGSNVTVTISIQPTQQLKGWGVYVRPDLKLQPVVTQNAAYALNTNYIRVELPPTAGKSDGTIDSGQLASLVSDIQLAKAHGVTGYVISIWSPPAYMKGLQQISAGVASDGSPEYLRQDQEANFAQYVANAVQALSNMGAGLPSVISIQNEPDSAPGWNGCEYTMSSNSIASWQRVVKETRSALDTMGLTSVILAGPECSALGGNLTLLGSNFTSLKSDSALNAALGAFAIHSYNANRWSDLQPAFLSYPRDVWMLEWSNADPAPNTTDLDWTLNAAQRMNADLIDLRANYWFWWEGWKPKNALDGEALLYNLNGSPTLTYTRMYSFFNKLWNTVRPTWWVKAAAVTDDDSNWNNQLKGNGSGQGWDKVDVATFENPTATSTVVVVVNTTNTSKTITRLSGLRGTTADVYETNAWDTMAYKRSFSITKGEIQDAGLPSYGTQIIVCH